MRRRALLGGVLALACAVTAAIGGEGEATSVKYRLEALPGRQVTDQDIDRVVQVLKRRLTAAGFGDQAITSRGPLDRTEMSVTFKTPPDRDAVLRMLERPGMLEFRIVAPPDEERTWREISGELDGPL